MTIYLVLPAFNEAESLPNLLCRFAALPDTLRSQIHIFVVNDGSTDATRQVALENTDKLTLTLVDHPYNMGLGQAVQTGIRSVVDERRRVLAAVRPNRRIAAAVGVSPESVQLAQTPIAATDDAATAADNDLMVIMDADDTHDPRLVEQLAVAIESGADIAIASRFVKGGNDKTAPFLRRLLSRGAAVCFKTVLPLNHQINDFTSGFRAYRLSLLDRAVNHWGYRLVEETGFACMVELLLKLRFWNPRIVEVPFYLQYDRKLSTSKIRVVRTIMQYLKLALRDRMSPPPARAI